MGVTHIVVERNVGFLDECEEVDKLLFFVSMYGVRGRRKHTRSLSVQAVRALPLLAPDMMEKLADGAGLYLNLLMVLCCAVDRRWYEVRGSRKEGNGRWETGLCVKLALL